MDNDNLFADLVSDQPQPQTPTAAQQNPFNDLIPTEKAKKGLQEIEDHGAFWAGVDIFNNNVSRLARGTLSKAASITDWILGGNDPSIKMLQDNLQQYGNVSEAYADKAAQNHPYVAVPATMLGEITKAVPFGAPAKGASLANQMLGYAGRAGTESFLEGETFDQSVAQGALSAGVAGAIPAIGAGLKQAAKPIAKALFPSADKIDEAAAAINAGQNITLGQATGSPSMQATENFLGKIPLAAARGNVKQAAASLGQQVDDQLQALGTSSQPDKLIADRMINIIKNTYDDNVNTVNEAYEQALSGLKSLDVKIPLSKTQKFISNKAETLKNFSKEFKSGELTNTNLKDLLDDFTINKAGMIKNDAGELIKTVDPGNYEELRKTVNSILTDLYKGSKDQKMIGPLKQIKNLMDDDLQSLATSLGDENVVGSIKNARQLYQTLKAPFEDKTNATVARALKEGDPDKIWKAISQNNSPHITKFLMQHLSPQDQMNLTSGLFGNAVMKATNEANEVVLPKLAKELHKMGGTIDALPDSIQKVAKGLQKLIVGSEELIKPSKAKNWLAGGLAAGTAATSFASIPAAVGLGAFTKGLSFALTNPAMVRGLTKLAGGKITKEVERGIIKQIMSTIMRSAPVAAGNAAGNQVE